MAAREYYAANAAAEVTTTSSTVWSQLGSLSFTPASGRDYVVLWSLEATNKTDTTSDARFRLSVNGAPAVAANFEVRGLAEYPSFHGFFRVVGDGVARTVVAEIQAELAGEVIGARNLNLVALALGAGDRYAETAGRTVVASESFATLVDLQWTPETSGAYLLLASSLVDNFSATAPAYARMECGATPAVEWPCSVPEAAIGQQNVVPHGYLWRRSLTAGAPISVKWRGRSHIDGSDSGWRDARVLALKLADFDGSAYGELAGDNSGVSISYSAALTVSDAASSNPQLLLANWGIASDTAGVDGAGRILDGGSQVALSARRTYSDSPARGAGAGLVAVRAGAAGPRSWVLERRSNGANAYLVRAGSALAALDLGAAGASMLAATGAVLISAAAGRTAAARTLSAVSAAASASGMSAATKRRYQSPGLTGAVAAPGLAAGLRSARRLACSAVAQTIAGWQVGLAKSTSGAKVAAAQTGYQADASTVSLRSDRRLAMMPAALGWARLDGAPRHGRALTAVVAPLQLAGLAIDWGQVRVLPAVVCELTVRLPGCALSYSNLDFWTLEPQRPEIWSSVARTPEIWSPTTTAPETWN